jgi:hypothetical protein
MYDKFLLIYFIGYAGFLIKEGIYAFGKNGGVVVPSLFNGSMPLIMFIVLGLLAMIDRYLIMPIINNLGDVE